VCDLKGDKGINIYVYDFIHKIDRIKRFQKKSEQKISYLDLVLEGFKRERFEKNV